MRRLYCPRLSAGLVTLPREEAHYALTVMRLRAGDPVVLFDGEGRVSTGRIRLARRSNLAVEADPPRLCPPDLPLKLTLAAAMPKLHRQGYLVEKCTELGVDGLWPIVTSRCISRVHGAALEKWRRRALEAARQAERSWVPQIAVGMRLEAAIQRSGEFDGRCVAHARIAARPFGEFVSARPAGSSLLAFVGPEGGWTDEEFQMLIGAGAELVSLGPTVLRSETAAIALCALAAGTRHAESQISN